VLDAGLQIQTNLSQRPLGFTGHAESRDTGLLTEHELTQVLQMLDVIQDRMEIENAQDSELADLEKETRPEDVLAEIDRLQGSMLSGPHAQKRKS
jgi:hypothetical protein